MPAINNKDVEYELGRLNEVMKQAMERFKEDRESAKEERGQILEQMTGINTQLVTLNGRTRRLEEDNEKSKAVWRQVADMSGPVAELKQSVSDMREPVQILSSTIRTTKSWGWRMLLLATLAFAGGNQALRVAIDWFLKQIGIELGIGS